jgi:hypothetical protein
MVKISISQAARRLGVSRANIQEQVNSGKLQTHEGYVTTDSIRLAYPAHNFNSECEVHIKKIQQIKTDATRKAAIVDTIRQENEQALMDIINSVKLQLHQEQLKNEQHKMIFLELDKRLEAFEKCCHKQDKPLINELQDWANQLYPNNI